MVTTEERNQLIDQIEQSLPAPSGGITAKEEKKVTQESPAVTSAEVNIFTRTPDGYDAHIKMTITDSAKVVPILQTMSAGLAERGFGVNQRKQPATAEPFEPDEPKSNSRGGVPPCAECGGAMWDNRDSKRNPKAPDFKCKDRDCNGAAWIRGNNLSWAGDRQN